jgi:hypothetical protein
LREELEERVFQNWVLRRICVPNMDELTGEWRGLHSEELYDIYSRNILAFKSRVRWAGHVVRMEDTRGAYRRVRWGDLRERDRLEDFGVYWRIILKSMFSQWVGEVWKRLI